MLSGVGSLKSFPSSLCFFFNTSPMVTNLMLVVTLLSLSPPPLNSPSICCLLDTPVVSVHFSGSLIFPYCTPTKLPVLVLMPIHVSSTFFALSSLYISIIATSKFRGANSLITSIKIPGCSVSSLIFKLTNVLVFPDPDCPYPMKRNGGISPVECSYGFIFLLKKLVATSRFSILLPENCISKP